MTNAKHTPGPWIARKFRGYRITTDAYRGSFVDPYVCTVDGIDGRNEANARLIAAAPELLEVCKRLLACRAPNGDGSYTKAAPNDSDFLLAEKAIAKAEGRE